MSKKQYSKRILDRDTALIWIITLAYIALAFICVIKGYTGSLPWLSVLPGCAWGAYAVSQGFYFSKSKAENKIKLTNNPNYKDPGGI